MTFSVDNTKGGCNNHPFEKKKRSGELGLTLAIKTKNNLCDVIKKKQTI